MCNGIAASICVRVSTSLGRMDYRDHDTRLGAYALVVDDADRMLLTLWNEPTPMLWTLPGGGVEFGETPEDGVRRELVEETGLEVELEDLVAVDTRVHTTRLDGSTRPLLAIRVLYVATVVGGTLRDEVDGSTDRAAWVPIDQIDDLERLELVDRGLAAWRERRAAQQR